MPVGRLGGEFGRRFTSTSANRRSTVTLNWSVVQCGMQFCESWLCKLALVSLSWHPLSFFFFFESPSSSPSLSLCLSIYLSLSLSQSWGLSLSRCIKKKKKKKKKKRGEKEKKNYSFIYLFFSVWRHFWPACAYAWARMVRSGLLLLTRSRWNAVRCYGIQFVYQR